MSVFLSEEQRGCGQPFFKEMMLLLWPSGQDTPLHDDTAARDHMPRPRRDSAGVTLVIGSDDDRSARPVSEEGFVANARGMQKSQSRLLQYVRVRLGFGVFGVCCVEKTNKTCEYAVQCCLMMFSAC